MNDRSDDPSHHERTLLTRCFISLPSGIDVGLIRKKNKSELICYHEALGTKMRSMHTDPTQVTGGSNLRTSCWYYFSFQPVLHNWCNKGYAICGMVLIKEPLLLIGKSSLCGGSGFPFSLSEWSLTICLTPYNRRERDVAQR